jgi:hypothetical protein
MANSYKKKVAGGVGTSLRDVYVAGAGVQSTVIGMTIANIIPSPVSANVVVYNSAGANSVFMVKTATIATGGTLIAVGGEQKLFLEPGDKVQVQMSAATSADVIVSVLEVS